jgi:hypothetical protein
MSFEGEAYTSENGADWTGVGFTSLVPRNIKYCNNLFIAVGIREFIYTSSDGAT